MRPAGNSGRIEMESRGGANGVASLLSGVPPEVDVLASSGERGLQWIDLRRSADVSAVAEHPADEVERRQHHDHDQQSQPDFAGCRDTFVFKCQRGVVTAKGQG